MKITINQIECVDLAAFADDNDFEIIVEERSRRASGNDRYYASFRGVEVKNGGILSGTHGNGKSPHEAIADYALRISEETLVYGAFTPYRKEVFAPRLVYSPRDEIK